MKLLIVLSVIACGYAAKLDRTYLPPANAGIAGGSPGSLNTPLGPSGFGQPAGFGQPGANSGFNAAEKSSGPAFGGQTGSSGFTAPSNQYGQPGLSSQSGQSAGSNFDAGFSSPAQNFGNQPQDYQRSQPQRSQASAEQNAQILRSDSQNDGETFSYSFETSNGISAEESGVATNGVQAQGAFAYSDDDGQNFRVQYTADENGYHPQGDHLPTPPPIPDEILKSIEENARAAASGTQEGAYNPDEDNEVISPQQYDSNAPTSYNQAPTGQNFNQAGKPTAQLYGAPNLGPSPQGGFPGFSQGPSQYSAGSAQNAGAARPSNGFGQPQTKSPSQQYGSSPNGDARPNSFGQQGPSQQYLAGPTGANGATKPSGLTQQGPSQQYSAGPTGTNGATKPTGFAQQGPSQQYSAGPTSVNGVSRPNSFSQQVPSQQYSSGPSGANLPAQPQQYQASPSGQFPSAGRPQGPAQAQDTSGYQYNKPQGGFGSGANGPSQQSRPQKGAPSGPQGFLKPSGSNAFPSSGPIGSFGASPKSQGSYGSAPSSNPQGPFSPSGSSGPSGPKGPSSFSSNGQASFASPARPNANFGPYSGSQLSSNGFGRPQAGSNGFNKPQGQAPGSMPNAGYEYNRPSGNSQFGGSQPQNSNAQLGASPQNGNSPFQPQGFKSADQGRPGQFGSPRAPPSFSEEEGYKY